MIKNLFKYPTTYLFTVIILYSVYDYFEHIGRSGSTFEEHPLYWLLFSVAGVLSFIIIVLLVKNTIQRIFNHKNLIIEVIAIGSWLALYISMLGPMNNKLFWSFDNLYFRFSFGPFLIILVGYFTIRIIINLILRKKALYSK